MPSLERSPKFVNIFPEIGCHAVFGAKKIPYITDNVAIRLKEMAVAIGAPIKPRENICGPQTDDIFSSSYKMRKTKRQTKQIIQGDIYRSYNHNNSGWYCEKAFGEKVINRESRAGYGAKPCDWK
jgi:hypothetical protein